MSDSAEIKTPEPQQVYKRPTPVKALEALARGRAIRAEQRRAEAEAKKQLEDAKLEAVKRYGYGANSAPPPPVAPSPAHTQPEVPSYIMALHDRLEELSRSVARRKARHGSDSSSVSSATSSSSEEIIVRKKNKKRKAAAPKKEDAKPAPAVPPATPAGGANMYRNLFMRR